MMGDNDSIGFDHDGLHTECDIILQYLCVVSANT